MACDTFLTMLALPVLYLLFGRGPRLEAQDEEDRESPSGEEARELEFAGA